MNATKAGRPQKNRVRFGASANARFFDSRAQLFVEIHNGQSAKQMANVKSSVALKAAFPAAYAKYKAAGGAL